LLLLCCRRPDRFSVLEFPNVFVAVGIGLGTFTTPDGSKYVGEFEDDLFHGQGIRYAANG